MAATKLKQNPGTLKNTGRKLKAIAQFISDCIAAAKPKPRRTFHSPSPSLQALTTAALALPGLMMSPAHAAEDGDLTFQYGRYDEGKRSFMQGYGSKYDPIHVDSINGKGNIKLFDRVTLGLNFTQDTWSGATPVTTLPFGAMQSLNNVAVVSGASPIPSTDGGIKLDSTLNSYSQTGTIRRPIGPARLNRFITVPVYGKNDNSPIHMMTSASPETRKQGDFKLGYEWDEAAVNLGAGVSDEIDYNAKFVNTGGRLDFNQKRTSLNGGFSYTTARTSAVLPDAWNPYVKTDVGELLDQIKQSGEYPNGHPKYVVENDREDWSFNFGLTQVMGKRSLLQAGMGYTKSTGYLENPYKAVTFITLSNTPAGLAADGTQLYNGALAHIYEQRPDERSQWNWNLNLVQHIPYVDAALHADYRYYHDDWGIDAHTFGAAWEQPVGWGWTITPTVRYYTQTAADFYHTYVNCGKVDGLACADTLKNFSSDHRLSGFGALSGGLILSKQFTRGISFEASGEYYTHKGSLKLDGGGEGDYADFNYYTVNAAMKVDLSAAFTRGGSTHETGDDTAETHREHAGHAGHSHHGSHAPAGVMFDHMLKAGDFMVGYRYMYSRQAGDFLHGSEAVSDQAIVDNSGCTAFQGKDNVPSPCSVKPGEMNMHMHMLDVMYAPTDWLTLMLMPQWMDMNMTLEGLEGGATGPHSAHLGHQTGGIGDTGVYGLVKLFEVPGHHVHATVGISAPTGDVGVRLNQAAHHGSTGCATERCENPPEYLHYGMQLGSGTWDFKPSVTYTGQADRWSWGAQVGGTHRMQDKNDSGYVLGDMFQSTAWGGYQLLDWMTASVRGMYTVQESIKGVFNTHTSTQIAGTTATTISLSNGISGPMDAPSSYGGHYWDVGFGLNVMIPSGPFKGHHVGFEWLQPVSDDVNGYQLKREAALSANWGYSF